MKVRSLHFILLIFIAGLVGYYIGVNKVTFAWKNYRPNIAVVSKEPPSSFSNVDFSLFWTVWQKMESSYYNKSALDPQKMVDGAISGMVGSIGDPYTMFLPPTKNTDFKQDLAGKFEGIGAELGMKDKQIIVVSPLDGSPAQKSGIRAGDAILTVNDLSTAGWSLAQAVEKIRGPKGTSVKLAVAGRNGGDTRTITIVRDTITVKSVSGWVKKVKDIDSIKTDTAALKGKENENILYLRLSQFGDNTNSEWLALVNTLSLEVQKQKGIKGIVFDLRNNPGGYLTDATFVASEFLQDDKIVVTQDRGNNDKTVFSVKRKGLFVDTPIIVLINKGSASASEIVAGALRDHKRARLIGETSFGKGTIQQAEDLGKDGAGLHITIAKWITPNGVWVHEKGLTPDVTVVLDTSDLARDTQLEKAVELLVK